MPRPADPADTPALVALAAATGVFKPHEIDALREVLDDYYDANHEHGHRVWVIDGDGTRPAGFAYFAPTAMTDRTWELWWIAVVPTRQRGGRGGDLLRFVEAEVAAAGARLLLIETSSTPTYHPTREFYLKHAYAQVAVIPDFYADDDGKVIFSKRLG
ncbi:MAG: GNAT family N-acetyltransferase [Fimbriiglobus sp.]